MLQQRLTHVASGLSNSSARNHRTDGTDTTITISTLSAPLHTAALFSPTNGRQRRSQ